jgi:putative ABC transport system permease protein
MDLLNNIVLGLRSLLRSRRTENELDEELRGFIEASAADKIRSGMPAKEAALAARVEMGSCNAVKHRIRLAGWEAKLEGFWKDVRYGVRRLWRSPGFTLVAVLSVAIGIGANTAIFSIVEAVLLRSLPFPEAHRLVYVTADMRGTSMPDVGFSLPEIEEIRTQSGVFEDVSPTWPMDGNLTGTDRPSGIEAIAVGNSYFRMLGTKPALGRLFLSEDAIPWMSESTVISYGAWQRLFGSDPHVLGRKIHLDYDPYTVVGVLPPEFRHPGFTLQGEPDFYLTGNFRGGAFPEHPTQTGWRMFPGPICRLKAGVSIEQGQLRLGAFSAELRRQFPKEYPALADWMPRIESLQEHLAGDSRTILLVMQGAVMLVLLLCCSTIANLLLARSSLRLREFAVRTALGASHVRLIRQLLVEASLISIAGAVGGVLLTLLLTPVLADSAPFALPHVNHFGIDGSVLLFTLVASIVTAIVCGLAPSIHVSRSNTVEALKEGGNAIRGEKSGTRLRGVLVAGQFAISLVLLIGAALMCRTLWMVLHVDAGFDPHHVLAGSIWLPPPGDPTARKYADPKARNIFVTKLLDSMRRIPGVEAAAVGTGDAIPLVGWNSSPFAVEGRSDGKGESLSAQVTSVSPEYFQVLGAHLLAGRSFSSADEHGLQVALINQTMANTLWRDQNAVGRRIRTGPAESPQWWVIVGVVNDIKADGFDKPTQPHIYFPIYQQSDYALSLFLRTSTRPEAPAAALESAVRTVDPDLSVFAIRSMDQILSRVTGTRRFMLFLLASFAAVALGLALMGVTAVTLFAVSQRTQEIGIRIALGANRLDVLAVVLRQGMRLSLWGAGAGVMGALLLTRFLTSFLFSTTPIEPAIFALAPALLIGGSLLACYFPARRATRMDPVAALRKE